MTAFEAVGRNADDAVMLKCNDDAEDKTVEL
jgi:hypothetical protein